MECPYCGAELKYNDTYYTGRPERFTGTAGNGIYYESTQKILGTIYKCPNSDYFDDLDEAIEYAANNPNDVEEGTDPEDMACSSSMFNGYFHTNNNNDLKEGFPC